MKILFLYACINCACRYLLRIILSIVLKLCFYMLFYLEKLSDKFINYKMKKNYISVKELRGTIIVKVKYILEYLQDKIIFLSIISEELPKRLLNIKVLFKICIFNVAILFILLKYFDIDFKSLNEYMGNHITLINDIQGDLIPLLKDVRGYLMLIILVPIFYIIWGYIDVRIKFYDIRDFLYKKIVSLKSGVSHNIEELNAYKISRKINYIAEEMTDDIGFRFINNKLKEDREHLYNHFSDGIDVNLVSVSKMIDEVEKIINQRNISNNFLLKDLNLCSLKEENEIINYKSDKVYLENSEYFKKYHNQIYKKIFTNVRVVRKDCLNILEERKKSSELWLQNYEMTLKRYAINLLVLELNIYSYYKRLYGVIFTSNIFEMIKVIILKSFKFYFSLIIRVLY